MLSLRTCALEEEVIPVEVAEVYILICSCLIWNDPWALWIFCNVITTFFHHLNLIFCECPCTITLIVLIEFITESYIVVRRCDEVCRCCVCRKADTTIIRDRSLACASVLCVDENDTGRSLGTIDCAGRSILEDRYRLDVVRIHLTETAFNTIDKDKRRA